MRPAFRTLALISLLALGAAACDSGGSPTSPASDGGSLDAEAILQQASEDLSDQTVRATFEMSIDAEGESLTATGKMAIDPARELAEMRFVFEDTPGMPDGTEMEMIVDRRTVYMRSPMFGTDWLKIDASDAGMDDAFDRSGQMDPSDFLAFLRGADGIEVVRTEEVRGVETTHFSGTLDLGELMDHAPESAERDEVADAIEELEGEMGDLEATFDAWVDAEGVPWRVSFGFSPEGADGSFVMTMDVLEIGGKVDVQVPDPKDVTEMGDLGMGAAPAA
jgi:hypothetical protein